MPYGPTAAYGSGLTASSDNGRKIRREADCQQLGCLAEWNSRHRRLPFTPRNATVTTTRPTNTALRQRTAPAKNAAQAEVVRTTGTARRSNADRIVDLFGFPGLANFSDALDHHRASKHPQGRRPTFPALALLATTACARITGSTASALTELQSPTLWARCRDAFCDLTEVELPDQAPTRDHIRAFRNDIATPDTMDALAREFTIAAIGQARQMGHLRPGGTPDASGRRSQSCGCSTCWRG